VDEPHVIKDLLWIGSSLKDLKPFPDEVQREIGYALYAAQRGGKAPEAKVLTGFGGAGVLEIVDDYRTDTYRAVYTVKFSDIVYVLHVFQKKSRKGNTTSKAEIELIRRRLRDAAEDDTARKSR
jgi:phage-related protein